MHNGPGEQKPHGNGERASLDSRAFDSLRVRATDPFSRLILHFGVKSLAHAALAAEALNLIESDNTTPKDLQRVTSRYLVEDNPLSFSLRGLDALNIPVPPAARSASSVFWPRFFSSPERIGFAHPDFINPLIAQAGLEPTISPPRLPRAFFNLPWSRSDLLEREKMGAALIFGRRVWESCCSLYLKQNPTERFEFGASEKLVQFYSAEISKRFMGDARSESIAAGERFIAELFQRDEEIAAAALKRSRITPSVDPWVHLDEQPPSAPHSDAPNGGASRRKSINPNPAPGPKKFDKVAADRKRIAVLSEEIVNEDPDRRFEAAIALRRWQSSFPPELKREVIEALDRLLAVETGFEQLEHGVAAFERGDIDRGFAVVKEVLTDSGIPVLRKSARNILKRFDGALRSEEITLNPTDSWPHSHGKRPLVEVLQKAYIHGADAEVHRLDGQRCFGRLCLGGSDPQILKLLNFEHEITWQIDLHDVQRVRLFYDAEPFHLRVPIPRKPKPPQGPPQP